jgi:nitroimidazol reductase NimA-like FMN-containing flavoprotein (pyridoxamine 5'-phosphate oxidase superfamily)
MRRNDRATSPEKAWEILENAEYMTLSMMGAEGVPYGVTLSFARVENALYFHCANEGYKLDSLRKNPAVCVNAVRQQRTKAEEFTVAFESAVAFGTACEVTEQSEKEQGLLAICKKYAPENPGAAAYIAQYPQVSVWRIDVSDISGKIHD